MGHVRRSLSLSEGEAMSISLAGPETGPALEASAVEVSSGISTPSLLAAMSVPPAWDAPPDVGMPALTQTPSPPPGHPEPDDAVEPHRSSPREDPSSGPSHPARAPDDWDMPDASSGGSERGLGQGASSAEGRGSGGTQPSGAGQRDPFRVTAHLVPISQWPSSAGAAPESLLVHLSRRGPAGPGAGAAPTAAGSVSLYAEVLRVLPGYQEEAYAPGPAAGGSVIGGQAAAPFDWPDVDMVPWSRDLTPSQPAGPERPLDGADRTTGGSTVRSPFGEIQIAGTSDHQSGHVASTETPPGSDSHPVPSWGLSGFSPLRSPGTQQTGSHPVLPTGPRSPHGLLQALDPRPGDAPARIAPGEGSDLRSGMEQGSEEGFRQRPSPVPARGGSHWTIQADGVGIRVRQLSEGGTARQGVPGASDARVGPAALQPGVSWDRAVQ